MPDSGDVPPGPSASQGPEQQQVRVDPQPPEDGMEPTQIVSGFLEALMANEKDFRTAKRYLTKDERASWQPQKTTVLRDEPSPRELTPAGQGDVNARGEGKTVRVRLTGTQLAVVDGHNSYASSEREYRKDIELRQDGEGEWRISQPPQGLVLGEGNFHRTYLQAEKYYFGAVHKESLVPEPVYVRRGLDLTDAVESLLDGPGEQLQPAVANPIPGGTELVGKSLAPDGDVLRVRLKLASKKRLSGDACRAAAKQVYYTAKSQTRELAKVELERADGKALCGVTAAQARDARPERWFGPLSHQYFIDDDHRLSKLPTSVDVDADVTPERVSGPLGEDGEDGVKLRSVGVARDERDAAAVSEDGTKMYVAPVDTDEKLKDPELTSKSKRTGDDRGLTAPSWDASGDVWVADRTAEGSTLYRLRDEGRAKAEEVLLPQFEGRIESLRVSAEGARIALLVRHDGRTTLQLGSIMMRSDGKLLVAKLQDAAPRMEDVRAFSWAGESQLIIVGTESGGAQQLKYVDTDGSVPPEPPRGLNGVTAIAAAERPDLPLIADSEDGVVRLPLGADWRRVAKKGTAPVYPG
ncbi:LpqB family beta-propeller domain-containing protein [Streptomyces boninensis]|uniref:LpqB family beta-propeller domain-containing protein n=1 Tax=Streptomyces boninensis TaxID=2039455 RepID=UPI003B21B4D6